MCAKAHVAQLSIKGDFEFLIKTNFRAGHRSAAVEGNISNPVTARAKNSSRYK